MRYRRSSKCNVGGLDIDLLLEVFKPLLFSEFFEDNTPREVPEIIIDNDGNIVTESP